MRWLVRFKTPVVYLQGSRYARLVTELPVQAPDANGARVHAIRVTDGAIEIVDVVAVTDDRVPLPPAVEVEEVARA